MNCFQRNGVSKCFLSTKILTFVSFFIVSSEHLGPDSSIKTQYSSNNWMYSKSDKKHMSERKQESLSSKCSKCQIVNYCIWDLLFPVKQKTITTKKMKYWWLALRFISYTNFPLSNILWQILCFSKDHVLLVSIMGMGFTGRGRFSYNSKSVFTGIIWLHKIQ